MATQQNIEISLRFPNSKALDLEAADKIARDAYNALEPILDQLNTCADPYYPILAVEIVEQTEKE